MSCALEGDIRTCHHLPAVGPQSRRRLSTTQNRRSSHRCPGTMLPRARPFQPVSMLHACTVFGWHVFLAASEELQHGVASQTAGPVAVVRERPPQKGRGSSGGVLGNGIHWSVAIDSVRRAPSSARAGGGCEWGKKERERGVGPEEAKSVLLFKKKISPV